MIKATKATIKRLQTIVDKANVDPKNYYNDNERKAYTLLNWIKEAEKNDKELDLFFQYDKENYGKFFDTCNNFYGIDGLIIKNLYGDDENFMQGLNITHHDVVKYVNCLDINTATIKDINKLAKLIIQF